MQACSSNPEPTHTRLRRADQSLPCRPLPAAHLVLRERVCARAFSVLSQFRIMQEKELSHGRLGMIAAAGFLAQEAASGDTWGTWWGLHPQLDGGLIDASF